MREQEKGPNKRKTGAAYETAAAEYLRRRGVIILSRNYRTRTGEIDLVGLDGRYLVFIEVKYRQTDRMGTPFEAVGLRKRHRILSAARWYLMEKHYPEDTPVRFDCIGITGGEILWIKDAFRAQST